MFKRTILSVSLIGLIGGSVLASTDVTNTSGNVQKLARSFSNDAHYHNFLAELAGTAAFVSGIAWPILNLLKFTKPSKWNESLFNNPMTTDQKLEWYTNTEKAITSETTIGVGVTVGCLLFALYHLDMRNKTRTRADALNNISTTLEQQEAAL